MNGARTAGRAAIVVAAVAPYLPVLRSYYLSDDFGFMAAAHRGETAAIFDALPLFIRPVALASFFLDHALFGLRPEGGHLVNILLHALCSLLVAGIARRVWRNDRAAFAAGLLFALHPAHPEAVSWISGRFDVLAACFALSSIYAYIEYRDRGQRRTLVASVAAFALAAFSKEGALAVPAVLVAYEALCRTDRKLRAVQPHFAALALYLGFRFAWLGGLGGYAAPEGRSLAYPTSASAALEGLVVVPVRALVLPLNDEAVTGTSWRIAAGTLLIANLGLLAGAILASRRRGLGREFGFALAFLPLSALPVAGLLCLGIGADMESTRLLYLPSVGYCLVLAAVLAELPGRAFHAALASWAALSAWCLVLNNRPWRDAGALSKAIVQQLVALYPRVQCPTRTLVVRDPPYKLRGAVVFRNGLDLGVELLHPAHPRVLITSSAEGLEAWWLERTSCYVAEWRPELARMVDVTAEVADAGPTLRWKGAGALSRWRVRGAAPVAGDRSVLSLHVTGDDPFLVSPPVPGCVALLRAVFAVAPTGPRTDAVFDAFWWPADESVRDEHLRVIPLRADGAPHAYVVPLASEPAGLGRGKLGLVRVDPASFPARVEVRSFEIVPCRPTVLPDAVVVESRGLIGDARPVVDGRRDRFAALSGLGSQIVVRAPDGEWGGVLLAGQQGHGYAVACSEDGEDYAAERVVTASGLGDAVMLGAPFDSRACRYLRVKPASGVAPFRIAELGFLQRVDVPPERQAP